MAIDIVKLTKRFKGDSYGFYLNLKKWKKFKTRYKLDWQKVRFNEANRTSIPQKPGLYFFVLAIEPSKLPDHGYILYVGEAGHGSSGNTLRNRYNDYLRDQRTGSGRPRVVYMLQEWEEDLFFHYVDLEKAKSEIKGIEEKIINALIPPINISDLQIENRVAVKAAF